MSHADRTSRGDAGLTSAIASPWKAEGRQFDPAPDHKIRSVLTWADEPSPRCASRWARSQETWPRTGGAKPGEDRDDLRSALRVLERETPDAEKVLRNVARWT